MQDKFSLANRNFSFWELDALVGHNDFVIVGAGLVGLSTALSLRKKYPKAEILILERSNIPYGASTRNAGFACFGSVSEIIDDINHMSEDKVSQLIKSRWDGLELLRSRVGDKHLDYQPNGGFEIFQGKDDELFQECKDSIHKINQLVTHTIGLKDCFSLVPNHFGFRSSKSIIFNKYEGQIHPGLMMRHLSQLVLQSGIKILHGANVTNYENNQDRTSLFIDGNRELVISAPHVFFTTNAFTSKIVPSLDLKSSRNQVLITKPIPNLKVKGCFHYNKGYVYFRNYQDRLLIGGGRHIAMVDEETSEFGLTGQIQDYLRGLIQELILPDVVIEEDVWWSGMIATGSNKRPIIKSVAKNVHVGVRLSGMGIALGSLIGQELAELV